ncbi:hypothetical protein D3C76_860490 [compost metagenome]
MVPYGAVWLQNYRHVPQFVLSRIALERSDNVFTLDDSRRFRHFIVGSFFCLEYGDARKHYKSILPVWSLARFSVDCCRHVETGRVASGRGFKILGWLLSSIIQSMLIVSSKAVS